MGIANMDLAIMADRVRALRADARRVRVAPATRIPHVGRLRKNRKSHL